MDDPHGSAPPVLEPAPPLDHAKRSLGVSASEIAAVMGFSKYEDAFTVYQKKILDLKEETPRGVVDVSPRRWGHAAETELLLAYCEITHRRVTRPGTLSHPERPWQLASPDGLVENEPIGVECKTADLRLSYLWGDPEKEEERDLVPTDYFLQSQYGASVTERGEWHMPVLIGGNDFRIYRLTFDRELEELMLVAAREFLEKHLWPRIPPPVGWSPASTEWIKKTYPRHVKTDLLAANAETYELAAMLYGLENISDAVARRVEAVKNRLKNIIGTGAGIFDEEFKILWKKNKDTKRTDWKALAEEYERILRLVGSNADSTTRDFIVDSLTQARSEADRTYEGARPFRATWHPKKRLHRTAIEAVYQPFAEEAQKELES